MNRFHELPLLQGLRSNRRSPRGSATFLLRHALVAMMVLLVSHADAQSQKAPPPPNPFPKLVGSAAAGKDLYIKDGCYECHGLVGQGGTSGPRLGPRPVPVDALISYVRQPAGQMPPYTSKVISDQELADIHEFLESLPHPPPLDTVSEPCSFESTIMASVHTSP